MNRKEISIQEEVELNLPVYQGVEKNKQFSLDVNFNDFKDWVEKLPEGLNKGFIQDGLKKYKIDVQEEIKDVIIEEICKIVKSGIMEHEEVDVEVKILRDEDRCFTVFNGFGEIVGKKIIITMMGRIEDED